MPTVPGTPGKARPVSKRTAAGGLGVVAVAAAQWRRRRPLECRMTDVVKGVLRVDADFTRVFLTVDDDLSGHTLYARNGDWQT